MAKSNNGCIIALPSETYAMSAQRLLGDKGIVSRVVKPDPSASKKGCSIGIETDCRYVGKARQILLDRSIPLS